MAINGSGIRDTAQVLKIDKNTIISTLKKANTLVQVNPNLFELSADGGLEVRLEAVCEVEMDEQWSYVGNKSNNAGYGTPLTTPRIRCWLMCLASVRMRYLRNSKPCLNRLTLLATTPMTGGHINVT